MGDGEKVKLLNFNFTSIFFANKSVFDLVRTEQRKWEIALWVIKDVISDHLAAINEVFAVRWTRMLKQLVHCFLKASVYNIQEPLENSSDVAGGR